MASKGLRSSIYQATRNNIRSRTVCIPRIPLFAIPVVSSSLLFKKIKNMEAKKVTRYYAECGKGFWKKQTAITHELNCKCWKNPKFKTCISCKLKNIVKDSNGMEHEPQFLHTFDTNMCKFSDSGIPVHKDFDHIRKYCQHYEMR